MPNPEMHVPYVPDSETKAGARYLNIVRPLINAVEADAVSYDAAGDHDGAESARIRAQGMRDFLLDPQPAGVLYAKELLRLVEHAQENGAQWKPEYEIVQSYLQEGIKRTEWRVAS